MRAAGPRAGTGTQLRSWRRSEVWMDTAVTVECVAPEAPAAAAACGAAAERAFGWFAAVEAACSRFDAGSELRRLCRRPGEAVPLSPLLLRALHLALEVARDSDGAFDPTVGAHLEELGFATEYRSGRATPAGLRPSAAVSWRDVHLNLHRGTATLVRPLLLDLGGLAKGLAVDLALAALDGCAGAAVEAGGDIALRGVNPHGGPWRIGIRHPRRPGALWTTLVLAQGAVCTSGDYERHGPHGRGHHLDPRAGAACAAASPGGRAAPVAAAPGEALASCTVVAPNATLADALGTAAMVLGPGPGLRWLRRQGVEALLLTDALQSRQTPGWGALQGGDGAPAAGP